MLLPLTLQHLVLQSSSSICDKFSIISLFPVSDFSIVWPSLEERFWGLVSLLACTSQALCTLCLAGRHPVEVVLLRQGVSQAILMWVLRSQALGPFFIAFTGH